MTQATAPLAAAAAPQLPASNTPSLLFRVWRAITRNLVVFYAFLALFYIYLPVIVVFIFSFNDNSGRYNFTWQGFTLKSWLNPCGVLDAGSCGAAAAASGAVACVIRQPRARCCVARSN